MGKRFAYRVHRLPNGHWHARFWSRDPWPWFAASKIIAGPGEAKQAFEAFVRGVYAYEEIPA